VTDADLIRNMRLDDPRPFFKELMTKTYRKRTVLSPHFYGMTVTNNTHTGHQLWEKFTQSWGKLQVQGTDIVCCWRRRGPHNHASVPSCRPV
jgi:hypothetical protein